MSAPAPTSDQPENTTDANGSGNAGSGTQQPTGQDERRYTQADIDRAIADRLARERKASEERTARQQQAAEQERLKAQAEWEELAKQHEQAVREMAPQLETVQARYEALAERNNKSIDAAMRDWPAEIRRLVPAGDDVAARLEAFDNARAIVEKFAPGERAPGNRPNPRPQSGPDAAQATETYLRGQPRYSSI